MRFLTLFLLLFPFFAFSQKTLLETSNKNKKVVRYARNPNEDEKISNIFLEKILQKDELTRLSYEIEYVESVRLFEEKGKLNISYRLSGFVFHGDNKVRSIDVSKLLLPSAVSVHIGLYDENSVEQLNYEIDTCCLTNPNDIHEWLIPVSAKDSVKVIISKSVKVVTSKLNYRQSDISRFNDYNQLIDEYYKTDKALSEIIETLNSIKTDNIDMMPLYQIDLFKVQKNIEKIENQKFFTTLDIASNDPIDFKNRFKLVKEQYTKSSTIVNHLMSSIDEVYFNKGYSFFLKNNYEKAAEYYERSIRANPIYVRSHYRLAEVNFIKGDIDRSAEIILNILKNLKIEKDIEANILALAQQIMLEYIDRGESQIRKEDFHQALKEFAKADSFCKNTTVIECQPAIYSGIENAKLGLYKSYLTIASKAIENEKFELAAKFIYDAKRYLNENENLNINHKETDDIVGKVIDNLIEQGRNQYDKKDYEDAVNTYNKAMDLCKLCKDTHCNTVIENEIKNAKTRLYENILVIIREHIKNEDIEHAEYLLNEASTFQKENKVTSSAVYETENLWMMLNKIKYRDLIAKGHELLNINNTEALQYLLKAKAIEKDNIAFPDTLLNSYIRCAGKPSILEMLSEAKVKAWANDIMAANKLEILIRQNISLYLLNNDSAIMYNYNDLINRIKEQECSNRNFEIEKNYISAKNHIDNSDYVSAFDILNNSTEIIKHHGNCVTDTIKTFSLKKEIKDLYTYQYNERSIAEAYRNLDFKKADSIINLSERLFESNAILRNKLRPYSHEHFLNAITDCYTLKLLAEYYKNKELFNLSLTVLLSAKENNCNVADFSKLQKELSLKLAIKDFTSDKKLNVNTSLKNYGTDNSWFSIFRKSYKRKVFMLRLDIFS